MSQMKELYEKVAQDVELQKKFSEILADGEKAGKEATEEKLLAFAKDAGFDVNLAEMQEYFADFTAKQDGELSDLELDLVAGGKSTEGIINVIGSVFSLGILCAAASLAGATLEMLKYGENCASQFN